MNFIFDIGNVILSYDPKKFLKTLWNDENVVNNLFNVIFCSLEWEMLDNGTISEEEAEDRFCYRDLNNAELIRKTMNCWTDMLVPKLETVYLLQELKMHQHSLYYLSNFHKKASELIVDKHTFFSSFNGGIFSCDVHLLKPNIEIYQCLLDKYSLSSQDCVFIDDTLENTIAAEKLGIKSIHFKTVEDVKNY